MIIANIKSNSDLDNKRRLQHQLLELEVSNEAEMERRMRDFKNPNKPLPVAPQFKTNSELRKDKIEQERIAIKNMEDLGFDYQKGAELVAWLSSSDVDKLVDFNANFKGIKKELTETTNPKLLTIDYLKNYLEKYFEDLDVSYGRRFAQQAQRETQEVLSVDELITKVPSHDAINELRNRIIPIQGDIRKLMAIHYNDNNLLETRVHNYTTEAEFRQVENAKRENEDFIQKFKRLLKGGNIIISLLELYNAIIPDTDFFNTLKLGLPPNMRVDLVRRYGRALQKIKALDAEGIYELIEQAGNVNGNPDLIRLLYGKMERALSFLGNDKGVNTITLISRQYESELSKEGKLPELEKVKKINDIQEQKERYARDALQNAMREVITDANIGDTIRGMIRGVDGAEREDLENEEIRAEIRNEDLRARQLLEERGQNVEDYLERRERKQNIVEQALADRQRREQEREVERLELERQALLTEQQQQQEFMERQQNLAIANQYYEDFINEVREGAGNRKELAYSIRDFLRDDLNFGKKGLKDAGYGATNPIETQIEQLIGILYRWIQENRIDAYINGRLPVDYDFTGERGRALQKPYLREFSNKAVRGVGITPTHPSPRAFIKAHKGYGLTKSVSKHFRDDERELKELAKSFKKHKKVEKEIDEMSSSSEDEVEHKKEKGGGLAFKHNRIKVGKGVSADKGERYRQFGKYVINMEHLLNNNTANFKYPSLGSIPSIRPIPISEDYKEFLLHTLDNERINDRLLNKLGEDERLHFERVSKGAGLLQKFQLKKLHGDKEQEETNRFNLLRGEILAGNNNVKVINELKGLILKMVNDNRIRRNEGMNMLMELSNF